MFARSRFYTPKFDLVAPKDWRGALAKLVRFLNRDDIRTVDALLSFVSRDYVASRILAQLLEWLPRAKRKDGLVYKSGSDWQAETGISADQVKTRKANGSLAELGIMWDVKRANKIPHSHYGFDAEVFVQHVADTCGKLVCEVKAICYLQTMPLGYGANDTGVRGESPLSLTELHTEKPQFSSVNTVSSGKILSFDSALEAKLVRAGLSKKDRPKQYEVLPMETIDACIADTQEAQRNNEIKYTVRSYLRGALQIQLKNFREGKNILTEKDTEQDADAMDREDMPQVEACAECGTVPHWFSKTCDCGEAEDSLSEASLEVVSDSPINKVWSATYNQLELQLDKQTFDTVLRDAEFKCVDEGVYVVLVKTAYAQQVLQYRLYRNVVRVLNDVVGEQTTIRFEIKG